MRQTSAKEIEAVLKLDGPARFHHFVKRVVDFEQVWGLWNDGWALMADSDGRRVFPLWPAHEYAELCAMETWAGYVAKAIPLEDLLNELLPGLQADGVRMGVFPTPAGKGVEVAVEELEGALREEMTKY